MGDRSPRSKQKDQQQKNSAKTEAAAQAKTKQDGYGRAKPTDPKAPIRSR
jgi:type II secretory pathway pseudopilin PulG